MTRHMSGGDRAAVRPEDRVVFSNSIEGLFIRGLGERISPSTRSALKGLGLDLDHLLPGYPVPLWRKAVDLVITESLGDRSLPEAYRFLGERSVLGLQETLLGKAMVAMAKLVGPDRTLRKMPVSMGLGDNYSVCQVQEKGPRWFELDVHPYLLPKEFMEGALAAVVVLTGGKEPAVRTVDHAPEKERIRVEVKWGSAS